MTSRRSHQCHKDNCDAEAQWSVTLAFLCQGMGSFRRRMTCPSTLKICGAHQNDAMAWMLSPENRKALMRYLKWHNFPPPDFETAQFQFDRVDHDAIERGDDPLAESE